MAPLSKIITHLDQLLRHKEITDYPGAYNGLQIENTGSIARICAAVDACETAIALAASIPNTLLLVHHGILWNSPQPFTGALRRKLDTAFRKNLSLYSSHLPLDLHPRLGNNALLAKLLNITKHTPAFSAKGQLIGLTGHLSTTRTSLIRKIETALDTRVHLAPGGTEKIRRIGICSGGSGNEVTQAAALGCDTFLCGEGPHHTYTLAEELRINLLYAGHYATETLGIRALAEATAKKFRLPCEFIHHPTGL